MMYHSLKLVLDYLFCFFFNSKTSVTFRKDASRASSIAPFHCFVLPYCWLREPRFTLGSFYTPQLQPIRLPTYLHYTVQYGTLFLTIRTVGYQAKSQILLGCNTVTSCCLTSLHKGASCTTHLGFSTTAQLNPLMQGSTLNVVLYFSDTCEGQCSIFAGNG